MFSAILDKICEVNHKYLTYCQGFSFGMEFVNNYALRLN